MDIGHSLRGRKLTVTVIHAASAGRFCLILERIISSVRNFLQKHCLFMPVLCMSKLPRPQQMALSGTRCQCACCCFTALWEKYVVLWPRLSPVSTSLIIFLWGYLKDRVYRNKCRTKEASKDIRLEIANSKNDG